MAAAIEQQVPQAVGRALCDAGGHNSYVTIARAAALAAAGCCGC